MKKAMIYGGTLSLGIIAMGTVFKIQHWPGASIMLIIGFLLLCFVFFPSALYLNYQTRFEKRKAAINLSALTGGIALMTGILFKIMHWPGSAPLMLLGWTVLLIFYLPLLLSAKIGQTSDSKEKKIYVLGIIGLVIFELATMFKIMHWPGAGPLLLLGPVLFGGVFIPMFTNIKVKKKEMSVGQFVFVITMSMYALVLTSLLSMNVSVPVLQHFVNEEDNNAKIISYFENKKIKDTSAPDSLTRLNAEKYASINASAGKIKKLVVELKTDMIAQVEQLNQQEATGYISHPSDLTRLDNYDRINHEFLGPNGNAKLKNLKDELGSFGKNLSGITSDKNMLALFDTSDKNYENGARSWEDLHFRNNILIGALNQLSEIEKNVLIVEAQLK